MPLPSDLKDFRARRSLDRVIGVCAALALAGAMLLDLLERMGVMR